jgi:1-phosphofructokinase family hexose kinase
MIHLFSPAPALDLDVELQSSATGKIGSLHGFSFSPGGKAVNVARFLRAWKKPYRLFLGAGGGEDTTHVLYDSLLRKEGLKASFLDALAPIRLNLVTHQDGVLEKFNHPGFSLSEKALANYERRILSKLHKNDVWLLTGRIPNGLGEKRLQGWVRRLEGRGVQCVLDTSGPMLSALLSTQPSFLKVNLQEMGGALGRRLDSLNRVFEILPKLQALGLTHGAITDGSHGAVVWEGAEVVWARSPRLTKSPSLVVGAGDAFLAGYLKAWREKEPLRERARWASASGAAVAEKGIGGYQSPIVRRFLRQVSFE